MGVKNGSPSVTDLEHRSPKAIQTFEEANEKTVLLTMEKPPPPQHQPKQNRVCGVPAPVFAGTSYCVASALMVRIPLHTFCMPYTFLDVLSLITARSPEHLSDWWRCF